jgi:hypothetical protein
MPGASAGGIEFEAIPMPRLLRHMSEYAFGYGRAADIAQANEQYFMTGHGTLSSLQA